MSVRAINWAWSVSLPPRDKLVLLSLANRADQDATCYPSIARISAETGIGERSVQAAVAALSAAGLVAVEGRGGRGLTRLYRLNMGATSAPFTDGNGADVAPFDSVKGAEDAPFDDAERVQISTERVQDRAKRVQDRAEKGAGFAPEPRREPRREPRVTERDAQARAQPTRHSAARPRRLQAPFPADWQPDAAGVAFAAQRGIADIPTELERCRAWHAANAKQTADPAASWRTWVLNAQRYRARDQRQPGHPQAAPRNRFAWLGMADDQPPETGDLLATIDGEIA